MRMNLVLICLGLLMLGNVSSTYAVEESLLPEKLHSEVLPYFDSGKSGSFVGKEGVRIAWRAYAPSHGASSQSASFQGARALVILNGRSEFMRKYAELVYDLQNSGYAIYLLDHRGQGESGRMLKQTEAGYVDHYQDYVDDFGTFMNEVVLKDAPAEVHVLGHSMGGLIASIYSIQHPGVIRSMALSAPMYEPNLGKYSECMALTIAGFMKLIGRETDIAPGRSLDEWKNPFDGNHVTHSAARYGYAQEFLYAHPDEAIGGPTYRWVQEAILGGRWVRKHAESFLTPVRILQDEDEEVVVSSFENQVCKKAKSCEIQVIDGAKHEMLMESDAQRNRAISLALDWFGKHSSAHQSE